MRYIDGANKVTDAYGPGKHGFTDGDPTQGTPATVVTDTFLNDLMREVAAPIEAWLGALNEAQVTQLRDAIDARITARIAASLPNFAPGDTVINDGGQLEASMPSKFPALPYTVTSADRGYLIVSSVTGTITLPTDGSLGSGFHCAVRNSGAGTTLTLSAAGGNIDGSGSITLRAGEGFLLHAQAANWRSIGRTSVAAASETASGLIELATTAEVRAGTDATRAPSVASMKAHQGMAQAWATIDQNAATQALLDSYGVAGVTDVGNGMSTITFTTAFLNTDYAVLSGAGASLAFGSSGAYVLRTSKLAGSVQLNGFAGGSPSVGDQDEIYVAVHGDQV